MFKSMFMKETDRVMLSLTQYETQKHVFFFKHVTEYFEIY